MGNFCGTSIDSRLCDGIFFDVGVVLSSSKIKLFSSRSMDQLVHGWKYFFDTCTVDANVAKQPPTIFFLDRNS